MDNALFGFFHFFDNLDEYINKIKSINMNYFGIAIGKFIILKDQITTNDGRNLGKKGEISYAFTSIFSERDLFQDIYDSGIIRKENFIKPKDIPRDEFDVFDNLKKGITLNTYRDFLNYIEENNLN